MHSKFILKSLLLYFHDLYVFIYLLCECVMLWMMLYFQAKFLIVLCMIGLIKYYVMLLFWTGGMVTQKLIFMQIKQIFDRFAMLTPVQIFVLSAFQGFSKKRSDISTRKRQKCALLRPAGIFLHTSVVMLNRQKTILGSVVPLPKYLFFGQM